MKITLLTVGTKMPVWVQQGVDEYARRMSDELGFGATEVPLQKRRKSGNIDQAIAKEGETLLEKAEAGAHLVALEVSGQAMSTDDLAERLRAIRDGGKNLNLLIGGPDGLSDSCRRQANECWSLSALTLPHPLVRIVITEQLYRAWSLLKGHPYHRQ